MHRCAQVCLRVCMCVICVLGGCRCTDARKCVCTCLYVCDLCVGRMWVHRCVQVCLRVCMCVICVLGGCKCMG